MRFAANESIHEYQVLDEEKSESEESNCPEEEISQKKTLMVPAHFHDVTHDKMKSNLTKNIAGLHLNHSSIKKLIYLIRITYLGN